MCARSPPPTMAEAVVDASALVDLLLGNALGQAVHRRIEGQGLHVPAHADAEVLSALGRLQRADAVGADAVETMLTRLAAAPIQRHPVGGLLVGAWSRRHSLRLADAVYVALAVSLSFPVITTAGRLHPVPLVEVVTG